MITILKADHKKYRVDELEKLRVDEEEFYKNFDNSILLQTCNRVEMIFFNHDLEEIKRKVKNFDKFDILIDDEAIIHLFRLASGLESMIVGEFQILGQLKNSYLKAKNLGKIKSKEFEKIILKAIHVGQRVRLETDIGKGSVSIASAAVELVEKLTGLEGKNLLLIGAGEMGTLVAKALKEKKIKAIIVANRTYEKAESLAKELGGIAIKFDKLKEALKYADIVISATSAPHPILTKERVRDIGETIIIDIANPRDTTDDIRELSYIKLFTIDDLRIVAEENLKKREKEIPKVEEIIKEEFKVLKEKLEDLKVEEEIKEFCKVLEEIREREVKKAIDIFKNKNISFEEVLENFSKALCKRVICEVKRFYKN
ncbi:glutamyl-tRNA reductase [Methanocaldococcus infernus ME]|uniref:Glutamyl-tRNA reductase n=1 Tax=Methanocaldococcus infernus (strain DSM 11812 / JCM 15783 / ME) TaxID=573063 RepID=D5VU47_METIM|nr:glutamyl-tRNA reductase [Methanocaldococcus infernus ME]